MSPAAATIPIPPEDGEHSAVASSSASSSRRPSHQHHHQHHHQPQHQHRHSLSRSHQHSHSNGVQHVLTQPIAVHSFAGHPAHTHTGARSRSPRNRVGSGSGRRAPVQAEQGPENGGESTGSEAEAGWLADDQTNPTRPSFSSSDDYDLDPDPSTPIPTTVPLSVPADGPASSPSSRSVSFSHSTLAHRRLTASSIRPSLHTAGSNISLETLESLNNPNPRSILQNDSAISLSPQQSMVGLSGGGGSAALGAASASASATATGSASGPSGYASPAPPYPGEGYAHSMPRIRRKSLSHVAPSGQAMSDTSTSAEDYAPIPGTAAQGAKGKKKRNRDGSFSLPFHRRRRTSNAYAYPYTDWPAWLGFGAPGAGAGAVPVHVRMRVRSWRRRYIFVFILLIAYLVLKHMYNVWRRDYDWEIRVVPLHGKADEVEPILPLKGCFDPKYVSPAYTNSSAEFAAAFGSRSPLLSPGVALGRGTSCYDFAATVDNLPASQLVPLTYHTYWRADLLAFGERQMATVVAFLATQPLSHSKLIVWTNGADMVRRSEHIRTLLAKWGQYLEVRQVDMPALTRGTGLEGLLGGTGGNGLFDQRAWVDGDAVRLLVLWHHGGVWMDMDQILTRDVHPLTQNEFVVQWDCYGEGSPFHEYHLDQPFFILNGALMHFRQHSPYLCEAFHIMASSPLPKPNTFTWGSHLYSALHRRLLAARIRPFAVLPWCFADPRNCDWDIAFPDPFGPDPESWAGRRWDGRGVMGHSGREMLEERTGQVWTVHLHNQWDRAFPPGGWMERVLDGYRSKVGILRGREGGREGKGLAHGHGHEDKGDKGGGARESAGGAGKAAVNTVVPPAEAAGAGAGAGEGGVRGVGHGESANEAPVVPGKDWDKVLGDDAVKGEGHDVADNLAQALEGMIKGRTTAPAGEHGAARV